MFKKSNHLSLAKRFNYRFLTYVYNNKELSVKNYVNSKVKELSGLKTEYLSENVKEYNKV